ncbi:major facilitator superfamily multidrug-resistance, DHA1 sub-family [Cyathus striatus]|nr:major facilitator superfamily multidrug-resistance, DHA1 sub-family [Cyathus striatus]
MASTAPEQNSNVEHENQDIRTPLPKFQLFMVLLVQLTEPVTGTVIYPFINQFVRDTGITGGDERKVGYYGGIIESIFFLAEALTVFHWGRLSDYYGRRPILLIGPVGLAIAMFGFGLSSTFWPLVLFRCLQGMFNGNIGVSKSVIAELTDSTNIGDAFSLLPLMWSCGTIIAPTMGGVLTAPAERWPNTLGKIALLREHPYFLPCFAAGMLALTSFTISFVGLKETLPSAIRKKLSKAKRNVQQNIDNEPNASTSLISETDRLNYHINDEPWEAEEANVAETQHDDKPPPLRDLVTRRVAFICLSYVFLAFTDMAQQVLLPLMLSTPIKYGGLGLDPYTIGTTMGTWGFANAFVQIMFLGRLLRRFGARNVFLFSYSCFFFGVLCYPIASYFARQAGGVDIKVAVVIFVHLLFRLTVSMCYGSNHILVVESAPNKASLGSLTGLVQMLGSGMRSISPSIASSLFSISLEKHIAGGHLVYYILLVVVVFGIQFARMVPSKA